MRKIARGNLKNAWDDQFGAHGVPIHPLVFKTLPVISTLAFVSFAPTGLVICCELRTHGSRRGVYSFAPSELGRSIIFTASL
jgi:hypothetical protein